MKSLAIDVVDLGKRYRIDGEREQYQTLKLAAPGFRPEKWIDEAQFADRDEARRFAGDLRKASNPPPA